jgi:predicted regulator of Ras-like GTPase activity (Roadblock/LC7/MglB family)
MATAAESVSTLVGDGVGALMLATADGLVVDAAASPGTALDFDNLAAEVAGILRAANLIGRGIGTSPVRTLALTLENGQMVVALPIAGEAIGVLIPPRAASYGDTLKTVDRIRTTLHQILELQTGKTLVEAMSLMDAFTPEATPTAPAAGTFRGRVALKSVQASAVGNVATVRVSLGLGRRDAAAKTVGRDLPGQRAVLAGEATIRAMLDLLPPGHAVELTHLQATTPSREALWALTRFLSPDAEQSLFGIAPVQSGDEAMAAAKAILNAVNRRIEILLAAPAS